MSALHLSAFEHYEEPILTRAQVRELVNDLPEEISAGLVERLNAALRAEAPVPFSDTLSELCNYLDGLEDSGSLPFEQLIQLKAYAMSGWREWRATFTALEV